MEFEFIDETEIVTSRGFGSERVQKTPSIFDTPLEDRTYWGNDAGSEILMIFARMEIRKSIKNLRLINIEHYDYAARLSKEHRDELRIYQLEMLQVLITQDSYTIRQLDYGDCEIVILPHYQNVEELYTTIDSE
jgi:hypothetical protein